MNSDESIKSNKIKKSIPTSVFEYGLLPPQCIDMEEVILGCIISKPNTILYVLFLKPEMFYKEAHQLIYKAILELKDSNAPIDILTVVQRLKFNNAIDLVGGAYYITQLTSHTIVDTNIQYHARIVYQMFLAREVIRLSSEHTKLAFDNTTDILKLLENVKTDFEKLQSFKHESKIKKVKDITTTVHKNTSGNNLILKTGWDRFDKMVSIEANKFILIGGAAKDGKGKFITSMMKRLLRRYSEDIIVLWATFEDKGTDIFYSFAAEDMLLKPKLIRNNFIAGKEEIFEKVRVEFENYPIHFIEESVTSKYVKEAFLNLASENPGKLPILIVDNILTLGDRENFSKDLNSMYDYVMDQFHQARNLTNGVVIVVHHYKDNQLDKSRVLNGFRPELTDLKGTESFRRIPNHVIMINNPHKRKLLYQEYSGKDKELLKHLFLIDVGANRDDSSDDEDALIRMLHSLDYTIFEELI
jgi:hypothetical protein